MKNLKKVLSIVLAMAMVLAMTAISGLAAETGSITINNAADGKEYKIFKIVAADVNASGGIDYDISSVPDALKQYFKTTTKTEGNVSYTLVSLVDVDNNNQVIPEGGSIPAYIQEAFYNYTKTASATATATAANGKAEFTDVDAGYYVIISPLMKEGTAIMVDSATNPAAVINEKNSDEPVKNLTKTTDEGNDNVAIGDTVTYTITFGTSNYSGSGADAKQIVTYVVKDALPTGLTAGTYTIKVNGNEVDTTGNLFGDGAEITWATDEDGDGVYTSIYESSSTITVTYTATVNDQATGSMENKVTITYRDKDNTDIGEPEEGSKTIYTYKLNIKKVDEDGYELSGAEFELYDAAEGGNRIYVTGSNGNYKVTKDQTDTKIAAGTAVVDGLDADKSYYLAEVTAPDGYNKITTRVEVKASLSSTTKKTYAQAEEYVEGTTYYTKVGDDEYIVADDVTEANFKDGTYFIESGEITIPAETPEFPEASVVNKKGAELPETGGIGTTIFYMIGTILVVGAGVVLITRRRMIQ
jgi:LPXTG-motif cell wall-anchored protein/uncharacterized repeat protein (TIGR01451 family)